MKKIALRNYKRKVKNWALVDDEDYNYLSKHNWCMNGMGRVGRHDGKTWVYMHRLVSDAPKGKNVDHINGNPLDNRKSNLRVCTFSENMLNKRLYKNSSTGVKGVTICRGKFRAQISIQGKVTYLGEYNSVQEAGKAYARAASEIYGEFFSLGVNNQLLTSLKNK